MSGDLGEGEPKAVSPLAAGRESTHGTKMNIVFFQSRKKIGWTLDGDRMGGRKVADAKCLLGTCEQVLPNSRDDKYI